MGGVCTHESKTKHPQRTKPMKQHSQSKDVEMNRTDNHIIDKISGSQRLNQPTSPGIPKHPLPGAHFLPFLVRKHHPQRKGIDQGTLHQRHHMHVPVEFGAAVEVGIAPGKEDRGEPRGEKRVGELVEGKS